MEPEIPTDVVSQPEATQEKESATTETLNEIENADTVSTVATPKKDAAAKEESKSPAKPKEAGSTRRSSRAAKTVTRFEEQFGATEEKEAWKVPEGKGTMVRDMPRAVNNIQKYTGSSDELKAIHRVMYFRPGKKHSLKQNILNFSGVEMHDNDETANKAARIRREELCLKWHSPFIKKIMDILAIDRSSITGDVDKESLIIRLIDWLEDPVDSGKKPVKSKKKTPAKATKKAKRSKSKSPKRKKKVESEDEDESEEEEVEAPKPKKQKKSTEDSESIEDMFLRGIEPSVQALVKDQIAKSSGVTFGAVKELVKEQFGAKAIQNKKWLKKLVLECFEQKN